MVKKKSKKKKLDYVRNFVNEHGEKTIDEGDEKGMTPLMIACFYGNTEVVEYLIEGGAGVNTECTQLRNTPLYTIPVYGMSVIDLMGIPISCAT